MEYMQGICLRNTVMKGRVLVHIYIPHVKSNEQHLISDGVKSWGHLGNNTVSSDQHYQWWWQPTVVVCVAVMLTLIFGY